MPFVLLGGYAAWREATKVKVDGSNAMLLRQQSRSAATLKPSTQLLPSTQAPLYSVGCILLVLEYFISEAVSSISKASIQHQERTG